jgi:cytidylate kinase
MKNCIVTISREFGSGGRDVGKLLANEIGLPYFDKEIMHLAAEKSGLSTDFIERSGESVPSKFLLNLRRISSRMPTTRIPSPYTSYRMATAHNGQIDIDKLFYVQSSVIKEIANAGGCVIIGRCASYILENDPRLLSVFIRGNFDDRVRRSIDTYEMAEKNAATDVNTIDKHRANYYRTYTHRQWADTDNYDLVVNTSYTGISGAASVIKAAIDAKKALLDADPPKKEETAP